MPPRWFTSLATLLAFFATIIIPVGFARAQGAPPGETVVPPPPPGDQPPAAQGPDDQLTQAQAHFQAGKDAFAASDFETAVREFRAAEAIKYSPKLDYNIGMAYDRMGPTRWREAAGYYRRYLQMMPGAPNAAEVRSQITRCEREAQPDPNQGNEVQPPPQGAVQQPGQPDPYAYQGGGYPPAQQPPPKKHRSYWWIVFPIVGGVLITILIIAYAASISSAASTPTTFSGSSGLTEPSHDPGVTLFRF